MSSNSSCHGRVAIVTGAGRGLGAAYARRLAGAGASVVVNDLGVSVTGDASSEQPAEEVVAEIRAAGGQAVASRHDVSDWAEAGDLVGLAVETFGRLDVLVNNAGVQRDRTLAKLSEAEWRSVIDTHLTGSAATSHHAARYWREAAGGGRLDARLVNTTSASGLFGNHGQANYAAAKAGIVALTVVAALELDRYGVTANCISPGANTRMNPGRTDLSGEQHSTRWPAAVVEWLASPRSADVTGRVLMSAGWRLSVAQPWEHGRAHEPVDDIDDVDAAIRALLEHARPNADMRAGR